MRVILQHWSRQAVVFLLVFCCGSLLPVSAMPVASSSLLLDPRGNTLYTANFDAGSISRIDLHTPQQVVSRALGKDIRRLALSSEGVLLATDTVAGKVWLLHAHNLTTVRELAVGRRPFGAVFDIRRNCFWVTLFEDHQLLQISTRGELLQRVDTADTPRGLALTSDDRLLVSHAMTGQLSVYDLKSGKAHLSRLVTLAETSGEDEFQAQGVPRLLDDIALSPDGREAWLPHVLWNFDHPFQFQSTVFPAVSVVDLEPGNERELLQSRKMLFRQINVLDERNRTLIVSNPQDAEFSPDGSKVYVSLAGSNDLMVFDLSRARRDKNQRRSLRRQGKLDQGGAQVTQILRDLPGDNPRGLVVWGDSLLVHNAMSRDLTRLYRGDDSPFARVRVGDPVWARTGPDRLNQNQRAGARLFHSGSTAKDSRYPMTGDFWMSCNSCHLDGFNFTNRYLMDAHQQPYADNAMTGHQRLENMIAGNFISDFIRIIQDTQGGMGHDQRDGAEAVDPEQPPQVVAARMSQLHTYVTLPENLPFQATWLRLDDERDLLRPQDWISSARCRECHSRLFDQWSDSNHRLMGASNPYYRVMEDVAGKEEGDAFRAWCTGCHNPQRTTIGTPYRGSQNHMLETGASSMLAQINQTLTQAEEGTGCVFCHRITSIEEAGGNASFTVNLANRPLYLLENHSNPVLRWLGNRQINARPEVHAESYSQDFYRDPQYCRTCHDEFSPGHGARIVSTYTEWEESSFNNPDDPEQHRTCIDCHMHADVEKIGKPVAGQATDGGPMKDNVVTHQFTGANHHLVGLRNPELEKMSIALLETSARLEQWLDNGALVVRVHNEGAGHALPTGVADFRQLWLQVQVTDAEGKTVFESGKPDNAGHLPEHTRLFMKVFGDEDGNPVGLSFWKFARLLSDTRIPADGFRDERFDLPQDTRYPVKVHTRLLFRIYPQWVTDVVREEVPLLTDPPVIELQSLLSDPLAKAETKGL